MKTNGKLMRIRLLNLALFGESKKEDFTENELNKLKKTSLNEVNEELKNISESYLTDLYDSCEKTSKEVKLNGH